MDRMAEDDPVQEGAGEAMGAGSQDDSGARPDMEQRSGDVINITHLCNQRCVFCSGYSDEPIGRDNVMERIDASGDEVFFQGGEPTLCTGLVDYIVYAKKQGKRVTLVTNGMRLGYRRYAERVFRAGLDQVFFAFHASGQALNDRISGTESYGHKVRALQNISSLGMLGSVRLVYVISKENSHDIFQFAKFISRSFPGIAQIEFKLMQALGNPDVNYPLIPGIETFIGSLMDAIGVAEGSGIRVMTNGIPLCYLGDRADRSVEYDMLTRGDAPLTGRRYLEICGGCRLKGRCMGFREDYLRRGFMGSMDVDGAMLESLSQSYPVMGKFSQGFRYRGHSCSGVHLLVSDRGMAILKFNGDPAEAEFEGFMQEMLAGEVKTPLLLEASDGRKYACPGRFVKLYEYLPSSLPGMVPEGMLMENYVAYVDRILEIQDRIVSKLDSLGIRDHYRTLYFTRNSDEGLFRQTDHGDIMSRARRILLENRSMFDDPDLVVSHGLFDFAIMRDEMVFFDFEDVFLMPRYKLFSDCLINLGYFSENGIDSLIGTFIDKVSYPVEKDRLRVYMVFYLMNLLREWELGHLDSVKGRKDKGRFMAILRQLL
jgi:hypothetical protein